MNAKVNSFNITTWDNAYSIGHDKIDQEHEKLFDIANKIYSCNDKDTLINIVKELIKYTKFHFKNEENFMEAIAYTDLKYHKKLHSLLVASLNKIIQNLRDQTIEKSISQLSSLVNNNILQHILLEDKKVHHAIKSREDLKERFRWRVEYKLKNELLDKEHEQLFIIALDSLNYNKKDIKTYIKITINKLYEYMKTHFEHEEAYMEEINYPLLEEHKKLHENIIIQMNEFIKKLAKLNIEEFEKKLIEYMDIWLINHILYEDRKFINFLKS